MQACPYCRKEYTKRDTLLEYSKVVKWSDGRELRGIELARAIYQKNLLSKVVVEPME
jgi:hypothetical protein